MVIDSLQASHVVRRFISTASLLGLSLWLMMDRAGATEPVLVDVGREAGHGAVTAQDSSQMLESTYYRIVDVAVSRAATDSRAEKWKPSGGPTMPVLEISGLETLPDGRVAVAVRKGEVWMIDGAYDDPPNQVSFKPFASALHEPLGLLFHDGELLTVQRAELTGLKDTSGDTVADQYRTVASGWGLTGHYHEYAYGPKRDAAGNLWITLNIGMGLRGAELNRTITDPILGYRQAPWRGWGLRLSPDGNLQPICAGMRSPAGLGANAQGDMFYTDQQGNWVATNSLHHMREGAFFHHAESLASSGLPLSPIQGIRQVPDGVAYPAAIAKFPQLKPPAVWFPYKKMGQSTTDILLDSSEGRFGPFSGQLFVGEFTQASINRVFLEKVGGEYQGACFPFRSGLASAVLRLAQGIDGSMFAGLTNRGWSSLGTASYGLQRLVWTGKVPPEILEMRAMPDGFELLFTRPMDQTKLADPTSYQLISYTYQYQSSYGSDEIDTKRLAIQSAVASDDLMRVRLVVDGLRPLYVHELSAKGLRTQDGLPLLHTEAFYTLNRIPER